MRRDYDSAVYEKAFLRIKAVLGRFEDIKRRMDQFPRRPELYAFVFEYMNRGQFRQLKKMIKELEKKADFCESTLTELESRFSEFLKRS
jgi:hypothetical protein